MTIKMNGPTDCVSYLQNVIFKDIIDYDTTLSPGDQNQSNSSTPLKNHLSEREELFHKVCDFATKSLLAAFSNLTTSSGENDTLNWPNDDGTRNRTSSR